MGFWSWLTGRSPLVPEVAAVRVWEATDQLNQSTNAMTGAISEAWRIWREVGEIHYVTTQQARLASRLDWSVVVSGSEVEHDQVDDIFKAVFGPDLPDLIRRMMLHLQVAGAFFLIRDTETQAWEVLTWPAGYKVKQKLDDADVVIEITNEDPADPKLTDSPVLAALAVAREILLTRQQSRVAARNRTAQLNTILYPREGAGADPDEFEAKFTRVMTEPLANELSSSSVVPNVIGFAGDRIKDWRTIDLTGPIDEKLHERVEHLIRQLAVILDIPPEIMTGLGESSHWNAWEISEDNWLGHVEPSAKIIGQALEIAVARAADLEPETIEIEPDPSPLLKRRPSLPDVMGAYDRGLVSSEWTRRQIGAGEEDAPGPGELRLVGNPAVGLPTVVNVPQGTVEALQTDQGTAPAPTALPPSQAPQPAVAEPVQPQAAASRDDVRLQLSAAVTKMPVDDVRKLRGQLHLSEKTVRYLADVLPSRTPETAAAEPFSTDRLAAIDQQAFDALEDLVDMVAVRVLERLGSQLRSSVAHDQEKRAAAAEVPNVDLPAWMGIGTLQNVDQTIEQTGSQILADGLARIVHRAYAYARSAGIEIELADDTLRQAQGLLWARFTSLIAARVDGSPTDALAWTTARRVIAVAGGNPDPAVQTAAPGVAEDEETPLAGIALGLIALDFIRRVFSLFPSGYRWQHITLGNPHPVHQDLDGHEFTGGTVPTRTYNAYIGDHAGCRCQAIPLWRGAGTTDIIGEPPEGVTVR